MKMVKGLLAALFALGLAAGAASAAQLMNETFTYSDGTLTTVGPLWTAHSGAGAKPIQVVSGEARLEQSGGSGEDVNRVFGAQGAAAKTYASFDVTFTIGTAITGDAYFAHLKDSGTFNFRARVFGGPGTTGWTLKFDNDSSTPDATWPAELSLGVQYKIVISYDASTGAAELWVNPSAETDPKITSAVGGSGTDIESFAMRQASHAAGQSFQNIDNIKVGTTFADVADVPTSTSNASWARIKGLYR